MKKEYESPEFDIFKYSFGQIMEEIRRHSIVEQPSVDGDDDDLG